MGIKNAKFGILVKKLQKSLQKKFSTKKWKNFVVFHFFRTVAKFLSLTTFFK